MIGNGRQGNERGRHTSTVGDIGKQETVKFGMYKVTDPS